MSKESDGGNVDYANYGKEGNGLEVQPFWGKAIFDTSTKERRFVGIDGALYAENPWDCVWLNGKRLPGIWKATATPAIQLDVQKPNGFSGAILVERGYVPAGITLTGRLWTPDQWYEYQQMLPLIWTPPNKISFNDAKRNKGEAAGLKRSIAVSYPGLNAMGINNLAIKQITPPEETSDIGVRQIKIIAIQYVDEPPKKDPANRKIKGAGSGGDRTVQAKMIAAQNAAMTPESLPFNMLANKPVKPSEGVGIHAVPKTVPPSLRPH